MIDSILVNLDCKKPGWKNGKGNAGKHEHVLRDDRQALLARPDAQGSVGGVGRVDPAVAVRVEPGEFREGVARRRAEKLDPTSSVRQTTQRSECEHTAFTRAMTQQNQLWICMQATSTCPNKPLR